MGSWWVFFFGEKDEVLVEEIAKLHKVDKDTVEKYYKEMLKKLEEETL